jgi:hypothetical protein
MDPFLQGGGDSDALEGILKIGFGLMTVWLLTDDDDGSSR